MANLNHPIVHEVARLGAPKPDEIFITHGSALVVRGVRSERLGGDIDLVASPENIEFFQELGWAAMLGLTEYEGSLPQMVGFSRSPDGRIDAFTHDFIPESYDRTGLGRRYIEDMIEEHDAVYDQDESTGLWVASKPFVIATKMGSGRQKDEDDIALTLESM